MRNPDLALSHTLTLAGGSVPAGAGASESDRQEALQVLSYRTSPAFRYRRRAGLIRQHFSKSGSENYYTNDQLRSNLGSLCSNFQADR